MANYTKVVLYYYTGTGNALKAAQWIAEEAEKRNIEIALHAIDRHYKPDMAEINDQTLIVFLSPTHGFNLAPAMMSFIRKFPAGKKADVFILNTRAGLKLSKLFIVGISGAGQFLPMILLLMKGYKVVGGLPLDMPSNWLFLHPGLNPSTVNAIVKRCEHQIRKATATLLNGKKIFFKSLVTLPLDLALLPITLVYYCYGRFVLAKTMIYNNQCTNCKICSNNCPVNAIKTVHDKPYWTFSCESCMRCVNICPHKAIETSHLLFVLILVLSSVIANHLIFNYLPLPKFDGGEYIKTIIEMVTSLLEFYVLYILVQRLLQVKWIATLFKYTSLSAYWRRYRAPGISLKDFKIEK